MNRTYKVAALSLFIWVAAISRAQQCSVSYSPDLSTYENEWADGSNIYTQVEIDGSGTMNETGNCVGLPEIVHTTWFWNSVGSSESGWVSGGDHCPDCYISDESDLTTAASTGVDYEFDFEEDVDCNIGGEFFSNGGAITLRLSDTYWGPPPVIANGLCNYTILACSTGKPTCTDGTGLLFASGCPSYIHSTYLVVNGSCLSYASVAASASGPGGCN